ncbi:MAG: zinc ribbon domain-containing protein, partial [Anaerolineae bacterium]|nr:zinc ribbon domain-containing protein [Anaerolineae bacterium]
MIFCHACGTSNRDGSRFCNQCGARLSEGADVACPRCGAPNAPEALHCHECGLDLARGRGDAWVGPLPRVDAPGEAAQPGAPQPGRPDRQRPHGLPPWLDSAERPEESALDERTAGPPEPEEEEPTARLPRTEWSDDAIPIEPIVGVPYRARERPEEPPTPEQEKAADLFAAVAAEEVHASPPAGAAPERLRRERQGPGLRLLIALALLVAVIVPLLWRGGPLSASGAFPAPLAGAARTIAGLPPGATVLMAFEYDAGLAGDLQPVAEALLDELLTRGANVLTVSTQPEGAALAEMALDRALRAHRGARRGERVMNLGYLTGGQAAIRTLAGSIPSVISTDWEGRTLAETPLTVGLVGARDLPLVVVLGRDLISVQAWIEQVGAPFETPLVAGTPALVEPALEPYLAAGLLRGTVGGLAGV